MISRKLQEICYELRLQTLLKQKMLHYLFFLTAPGETRVLWTNTPKQNSFRQHLWFLWKKPYLNVSIARFSEVVGTDPVFLHSSREPWLLCPQLSWDFHLFLWKTPYFYVNHHITYIPQATCVLLQSLPKWTLPQFFSISYKTMSPGEQRKRLIWGNFHKSKSH